MKDFIFKVTNKSKFLLAIFCVVSGLFLISLNQTNAQEEKKERISLRVDPAIKIERLSNEEKQKEFGIKITNSNDYDVSVSAYVKDFNRIQGNTVYVEAVDAKYPLSPFVTLSFDNDVVKAGESVEVKVSVDSTNNDLGKPIMQGGVFFDAVPVEGVIKKEEGDSSKASLGASLGCLVYVTVSNGNNSFKGEITNFDSEKFLWRDVPIWFDLGYENKGDFGFVPEGRVEVKNVFGNKIDEAVLDYNYLPTGEIKDYKFAWPAQSKFGYYKVKVEFVDGDGNFDIREQAIFVLPTFLIFLIVLILVIFISAIGFLGYRKKSFVKGKSRY